MPLHVWKIFEVAISMAEYNEKDSGYIAVLNNDLIEQCIGIGIANINECNNIKWYLENLTLKIENGTMQKYRIAKIIKDIKFNENDLEIKFNIFDDKLKAEEIELAEEIVLI